MSPKELRELLLYGPYTDETFRKLPPEAAVIWLARPNRKQIQDGKAFMYLRVGLIILGAIYLAYVHRDDEARALLFIIATYEFAYYNLRKEKSEHDYFLAQELYSKNVDELIKNLQLSSHE